jgi:hypothetical protein
MQRPVVVSSLCLPIRLCVSFVCLQPSIRHSNKNLWEELIAYLLLYDTDRIENDGPAVLILRVHYLQR